MANLIEDANERNLYWKRLQRKYQQWQSRLQNQTVDSNELMLEVLSDRNYFQRLGDAEHLRPYDVVLHDEFHVLDVNKLQAFSHSDEFTDDLKSVLEKSQKHGYDWIASPKLNHYQPLDAEVGNRMLERLSQF